MKDYESIPLTPIGFVKTSTSPERIKKRQHTSEIILRTALTTALDGLHEFSHIFVIYWLHDVSATQRNTLKVHPRGRRELPLLGVFATRSPHRPNPIGLTITELVHIDRNVITVRGLDAYNGTPVLDLKPVDTWDTDLSLQVPGWWTQLEHERTTLNNEN
jgi:tRNA-Thr(GGU) m(6)t(6)A37 methyltransferase TsaA